MDHKRMGDAIDARRKELGLTKAEVSRRASIDASTLYLAITGSPRSMETYEAIEEALQWPVGTLASIGQGGHPPKGILNERDRLRHVEREVSELRGLVQEVVDANSKLSDQVGKLLRGLDGDL